MVCLLVLNIAYLSGPSVRTPRPSKLTLFVGHIVIECFGRWWHFGTCSDERHRNGFVFDHIIFILIAVLVPFEICLLMDLEY